MGVKPEDYVSFGGETVPVSGADVGLTLSFDQYDKMMHDAKIMWYNKDITSFICNEPDMCPSCGTKHFQVLYNATTDLATNLIYNKDHWEFTDPNLTCMRVKCLECGTIYNI